MNAAAAVLPAAIPSPTQGVWHLGPFPLRAYALCIILGIVLAVRMGERRYVERGGEPGVVLDVAAWAVPFGIVGGRLYHVITSYQPYFGKGGDPVKALYIWEGGLGIWGAVALGAVGAYIGARRRGVYFPPLGDALAPGILLAQAVGRWGNWFNNELFGRPTDLPWGLTIHEWDQAAGRAVVGADGKPVVLGTYHPTFLYEALWSAVGVVVLLWADKRFKLGHGRVIALYIAVYTSGRLWIEAMRIDTANKILGLRVNIWVAAIVLLVSVVAFVLLSRRKPGRDTEIVRPGAGAAVDTDAKDTDAKDDAKDAVAETDDDVEDADASDDAAKDEPEDVEAKDESGDVEATTAEAESASEEADGPAEAAEPEQDATASTASDPAPTTEDPVAEEPVSTDAEEPAATEDEAPKDEAPKDEALSDEPAKDATPEEPAAQTPALFDTPEPAAPAAPARKVAAPRKRTTKKAAATPPPLRDVEEASATLPADAPAKRAPRKRTTKKAAAAQTAAQTAAPPVAQPDDAPAATESVEPPAGTAPSDAVVEAAETATPLAGTSPAATPRDGSVEAASGDAKAWWDR